jgi:hypothetical protein
MRCNLDCVRRYVGINLVVYLVGSERLTNSQRQQTEIARGASNSTIRQGGER